MSVLETKPLAVADGIARTSRPVPVRLSVPLEGLSPGRYEWQITVIEPTGRKAAFWRADIAVVP